MLVERGQSHPSMLAKRLAQNWRTIAEPRSMRTAPTGDYRKETTPVDQFDIANAFGLSDMHGNVWEWCEDPWHENYDGAPTDGRAWLDGGDSSYRVQRGGSWLDDPRGCRSAYRYEGVPGLISYVNVGFRVCCSAPRTL
jgi:formylglycine-generating enzyme required for sulfatase activity